MIYNWSAFDIVYVPIHKTDLRKFLPPDESIPSGECFIVDTTNAELVDPTSNKYVHPSPDDVVIDGDDSYGVVAVVDSIRQGSTWQFKVVLRKLVKEKFAPTKSFGMNFGEVS